MRPVRCRIVSIWLRRFLPRPAKKGCALNAYSPPADYDLLDSMADAYDQQPYFSHVFPWSAPGYIRAAAHLYGIQTPPVARARILEVDRKSTRLNSSHVASSYA